MRIHQPTAVGADDGDSRFTAVAVEHFHEPPIEEKMARGTCPPMMATTIMTFVFHIKGSGQDTFFSNLEVQQMVHGSQRARILRR